MPLKDPARLDVWLDIACLFKTRSEAQRACRGGKVYVNDQRGKPHRILQNGDRLAITRPNGRKQHVVVRSLAAAQHVPKATARGLYDDVTPPPTSSCAGSAAGRARPDDGDPDEPRSTRPRTRANAASCEN